MSQPIISGTVTVRGLTPGLLMHRWSEKDEDPKITRPVHVEYGTTREEADRGAYKLPDGQLYLPGTMFSAAIRAAGRRHKQPTSRQSLMYIIPAAIVITMDAIPLQDLAGEPLKDFEVDSRPVVIPATKGRIMRHRARIEEWQATISFDIDTEVLSTAIIHQLFEEAGRRNGVGDFRPSTGGPYGRFAVINWQED